MGCGRIWTIAAMTARRVSENKGLRKKAYLGRGRGCRTGRQQLRER